MMSEFQDYIEDKISKYMFKAKNFTKEEMDRVDEYCKLNYGNDRKKMILTLIHLVENHLIVNLLDEKINYISTELLNRIEELEKKISPNEKKSGKISWKGFSNADNNK